ncbi:MAG TPA: glutathione S-transferase [Gammaproteobacteria bacterium]|nr:glutathione S-transferase [Gammaproteobacteria bacterium]
MTYELYYWPGIQGRGEFVRLALEAAGAGYADIAKHPDGEETAVRELMRVLGDTGSAYPPFAPPILKAGELLISQTANILMYLGARHGLAPNDEAGRLWTHQLQLTLADWIADIHDAHHPLGPALYYAQQKSEAGKRTALLLEQRIPKFMRYFERVLQVNPVGNGLLVADTLSYVDLSLFQILIGLRYAFPRAMARMEPDYPGLRALREQVAARPRIAAYLASGRRIPFNEDGLFRHYPELDP